MYTPYFVLDQFLQKRTTKSPETDSELKQDQKSKKPGKPVQRHKGYHGKYSHVHRKPHKFDVDWKKQVPKLESLL